MGKQAKLSFHSATMHGQILFALVAIAVLSTAWAAPHYDCKCGDNLPQCQDRPSTHWDCRRLPNGARLQCLDYQRRFNQNHLIVDCSDLREKKWCVSGGQLGSILQTSLTPCASKPAT